MDKRWKGRIISALRRLTFSYPPRNAAKKKQQVAPATFECEHCGKWCYSGSSEDNLVKIQQEFPDNLVEKDKVALDHISPIIDPIDGFTNWDDYVNRMFCDEDGFQVLCSDCDEMKRTLENIVRKENK